jgi:hypothetical protein
MSTVRLAAAVATALIANFGAAQQEPPAETRPVPPADAPAKPATVPEQAPGTAPATKLAKQQGDGKQPPQPQAELQQFLRAHPEVAERLIAAADADHDGKLTGLERQRFRMLVKERWAAARAERREDLREFHAERAAAREQRGEQLQGFQQQRQQDQQQLQKDLQQNRQQLQGKPAQLQAERREIWLEYLDERQDARTELRDQQQGFQQQRREDARELLEKRQDARQQRGAAVPKPPAPRGGGDPRR